MSEPTKPQRDKYRFVPIGYFIGGFCSSLSGMLYLTEGYLTVNFASLGVIPIWMWLGAIAVGLSLPIMNNKAK